MPFNPKKLCAVEIENIKPIGLGDNICLTMLSCLKGEYGLLTGTFNRALFLTSAHSNEIDCGCVSTYVLCSDDKTKYLSDLRRSDELVTVNPKGNGLSNKVIQTKTKKRPMFSIQAKYTILGREIFNLLETHGENYFNGYRSIFRIQNRKTSEPISVLDIPRYEDKREDICALLNTGTIVTDSEKTLLTCIDGRPKSIKQLKQGDKVLVYVQMPGVQSRHFGMAYDGCCIER